MPTPTSAPNVALDEQGDRLHVEVSRLRVEVSLWSADLSALGVEVERLAPYADAFHIDASDTRFVPTPLFFPDLVASLRPRTSVPLHVHLMARWAGDLAEAFVDAGADMVTVHAEAEDSDTAVDRVRAGGAAAGVALVLATPPEVVLRHVDRVTSVVMVGTPPGTRGGTLDTRATGRIARVRQLLDEHAPDVSVVADGGIRADTVPALAAAGASAVVAGSLLLAGDDLAATTSWLRSHTADGPARWSGR